MQIAFEPPSDLSDDTYEELDLLSDSKEKEQISDHWYNF
jgi:hypothetical protein